MMASLLENPDQKALFMAWLLDQSAQQAAQQAGQQKVPVRLQAQPLTEVQPLVRAGQPAANTRPARNPAPSIKAQEAQNAKAEKAPEAKPDKLPIKKKLVSEQAAVPQLKKAKHEDAAAADEAPIEKPHAPGPAKKTRKPPFQWCHNMDKLLILKFREAIDLKMVDPNSQAMNSWDDFVAKLWNCMPGIKPLDASAAKARWNDNLKRRYKNWLRVENWSGGGAEGIGGELSEEAWAELIAGCPDAAEFRNSRFEFATEMDSCLNKKVPSFEAAISAANLVSGLNGLPKSTKPVFKTDKSRRRSAGAGGAGAGGGGGEGGDFSAARDGAHAAVADAFGKMGKCFESKTAPVGAAAADYQEQALQRISQILPALGEEAMAEAMNVFLSEVNLCSGFVKIPTDSMRHLWLKKKLADKYSLA